MILTEWHFGDKEDGGLNETPLTRATACEGPSPELYFFSAPTDPNNPAPDAIPADGSVHEFHGSWRASDWLGARYKLL